MSKQINPAKLGIFVLVAIALTLGTLVVVSSGRLFKKSIPFVMYFDNNASGLKPGAPVLFRGVSVGQVTKIQLVYNSDTQKFLVPVYISIDPSKFVLHGSTEHYPLMEDMVKHGLRAQLHTQSFVTGMLQVMLVEAPNVPIVTHGIDPDAREIPTAPSFTQALTEEMKEIDISQIASDLKETVNSIRAITQKIQSENVFTDISNVLTNLETVTEDLSKDLPKITTELSETSESVRELIAKSNKVLTHTENILSAVDKKTPGLLTSAEQNSEKFKELQDSLIAAVDQAESMINNDSPLRYNFARVLDRIAKAASQLEVLLFTVERNPEVFITGKPEKP
ncbi:MlaD family protein [Kiritimatiellota bacterium B12222]|nr:MlaD family protein [Kiritimatiellota bacterium B12222]